MSRGLSSEAFWRRFGRFDGGPGRLLAASAIGDTMTRDPPLMDGSPTPSRIGLGRVHLGALRARQEVPAPLR